MTEMSDIVHAATCLYADAVLITNDRHFDKIKKAGIIEVWSNAKAIKRLLDEIEDCED
jgi:predicted nucleic acid-binding protein